VQIGQNAGWTEQKPCAFLQTLGMKRFLPLLILALAVPLHAETSAKTEATPSKKSSTAETDLVKEGPVTDGPPVAAVSSIEVEDIQGFEHYAPQIQELIRKCLALTKLNLTYTFGSSDPKNGGMDCSGAIYFVLHDFGFKGVPRQSNEMAGWVQDKTLLYRVTEADTLSHGEFSSLQPGNLLFWSGTYVTAPRKIPVTHVMLYLGKLKKSGKHIVFGSSDGRAYQGKRRTGVSVFDFSLPKSTSTAKFYGYGMIPGVGKIETKPEPVLAETKVEPAAHVKAIAAQKPEVVEKAETKPVVKPAAKATEEEIRPAIMVDAKTLEAPSSVAAKSETAKAKDEPEPKVVAKEKPEPEKTEKPSEAKKAPVQVASAKKSTPSSQKKTTSDKPRQVVRKKAAPPPTPLDRARRATESFFQNVRRSIPGQ
jgi:cell wall-associated NlpC family hydrolase